MIKQSVLTKHITYNVTDKRKNLPVMKKQRTDLRQVDDNRILKRILDEMDNSLISNKTFTSFTEAINELSIDTDIIDEVLFKRWIQYDNTFYLLEDIIKTNQLSSIKNIKQFINNLTIDQVIELILQGKYSFTTYEHLHQELGINLDISPDVFFVRFANNIKFFDNEIKLYIQNVSKITEYIINELKSNIDTYITKLYVMNKYKYL